MKISDDYNAKFEIWAKERKVFPMPKAKLPFRFAPRKFSSYEELNQWKKELLVKIAEKGGVKWSR